MVVNEEVDGRVEEQDRHRVVEQPQHKYGMDPDQQRELCLTFKLLVRAVPLFLLYSSRKWPSGSVFNMNKYFASGNKQDTYNMVA